MSFEIALREELLPICSKIYPLNAPEGTLSPYIVYTSGEGIHLKTLVGFIDLKNVNFQLDILADSYSSMKALAKQVINKLKTFELRVIGINGPYIQELTFDDNSPELYESEIFLYRKIISFTVSFKEE